MAYGRSRPGSNWGGARIGTGPKPGRNWSPAPVSPFIQAADPFAKPDSVAAVEPLAVPPIDLNAEQQEFWRVHAPLALERKTLTPATAPMFKLLCELHVKKVMVGLMVDKGALGGLRVFMQLAKQVEGLMGRFCLGPFGKPVHVEKPKATVNPFAAFGK